MSRDREHIGNVFSQWCFLFCAPPRLKCREIDPKIYAAISKKVPIRGHRVRKANKCFNGFHFQF